MRRFLTLTFLLAASVTVMQAQTAKNVLLEKDGTMIHVKMDLDLKSARPRAATLSRATSSLHAMATT